MAEPIHSALALFSGGQDSSVCLALALERCGHVETVGFDYGQRHVVELEARDVLRAELARRERFDLLSPLFTERAVRHFLQSPPLR